MNLVRKRLHVASTALLSVVMLASALGDLLHHPALANELRRLGYPQYLLTLLGVAKLCGVPALWIRGLPRLTEWAYAGFAFELGGATFSQLAARSTLVQTLPPLVCGALVVISLTTYRAVGRSSAPAPGRKRGLEAAQERSPR
jgi:hypothetical protein